jgi:hypothetical protein
MDKELKALKQKAIHEFKEFLFVFIYLWVFLATFIEFKSLVLAQRNIDFVAHGVALINALVLAKFMLIARAFHPARSAEGAPLIYPTLLKSAIFAITLAVFKALEDVIVGYFKGKSWTETIAELGGGSGKTIAIVTVMLFVVLIPLTAFGELERVVGAEKLHALFLVRRDASKPFGQQVV